MEDKSEERSFGEVDEREVPETDTDTTVDEKIENNSEDNQEVTDEKTDNQGNLSENTEENKDDSQESSQEVTEKGTKLDKNPLSAAHQQLANERKVRGQMESVLADPKLIARFVKEQYGIDMPMSRQTEKVDENKTVVTKKWSAKDFESLDDVADKFNQLQDSFSSEIKSRDSIIEGLKSEVGGIQNNGRLRRIADTAESDVNSLKNEPELNSKSPDFIPGLESKIGALYHRLDFDSETGTYKGQYSIREIGDIIIATARDAKKAGIQRGQTIIKDKTGGKIRISQGKNDSVDTDKLSPGASIAAGVARMFK